MVTTGKSQQGELHNLDRRPSLMSRTQLVERIIERNPTATPEFLDGFSQHSLAEYLDHLCTKDEPLVPWVRPNVSPAIVRREATE